jgi:hypothetical protein
MYNIKKFTFIPSAFGVNKRVFATVSDVYVENTYNFHSTLM